jgi:hypothetical protein
MIATRRRGRLRGALALDTDVFREIADSPRALPGAVLVVIIATMLSGLGGLLWTGRLAQDTVLPASGLWGGFRGESFIETTDVSRFIARSLIAGGVLQVMLWGAWVAVTWLYLWAFGSAPRLDRLARVMGYGFAPVALELFIAPSGMEIPAALVAFGYTFAAMAAGVEAAAAVTRGKAAVAVLAGMTFFGIALSLLGSGHNDFAPGIFSLDPLPISVASQPNE